jgi:toxin-antitoxin system PIN domain toxin
MIALDTNLLVYSHREDSQWHAVAYELIEELAESLTPWAIPWPCIHEFLSIVTHPKIFDPPTPFEAALEQVEAWLQSPSLLTLCEAEGYWDILRPLIQTGRIIGPQVHDARIAALCKTHGIDELWSADRDFGRFPGLPVRNPLVGR